MNLYKIKRSLVALLTLFSLSIYFPVFADCGLTESPNSSWNSSSEFGEVSTKDGVAILSINGNSVSMTNTLDSKTTGNLFETIEVAPPIQTLFASNVTNRRFFINGKPGKDFDIQIKVEVASEEGAATNFRGFAIEETDSEGNVLCDVIDGLTFNQNETFNLGLINNPTHFNILDNPNQGFTATINAKVKGCSYYQLGFNSLRAKSKDPTTVASEAYNVTFGKSSNASNNLETIIDSSKSPNSNACGMAGSGELTGNNITINRPRDKKIISVDINSANSIPDGNYKFKPKQDNSFILLDSNGAFAGISSEKGIFKIKPKKPAVKVNAGSTTKKDISIKLSKKGKKFRTKSLDSSFPKAIFEIDLISKSKKSDFDLNNGRVDATVRFIDDGSSFFGEESVIEYILNSEGDAPSGNVVITALLDPNEETPDGAYAFNIEEAGAIVTRDNQLLEVNPGNDPLLTITAAKNTVDVFLGGVASNGEFSFALTEAGVNFLNTLQAGDKVFIGYKVINDSANDPSFRSDSAAAIHIKIK